MNKAKQAIFLAFGLLIPSAASAQALWDNTSKNCKSSGDCRVQDMIQVGVNAANFLLQISGAVALLFFVIGGFIFIFSGGNEKQVAKGKAMIVNAAIGLVIIFTSFMIINFVVTNILGVQGANITEKMMTI